MRQGVCVACGKTFEAQRSTKRYCSTSCRTRASTGAVVPMVKPEEPKSAGSVYAATLTELTEANRVSTAQGQAALRLAELIDAGGQTGSAVAALTKEWATRLAVATEGAAVKADPVDELRMRRDRKFAG